MNVWDYLTSWEFWRTLGAGLGGGVVATAILVWLGKTWMTQRIQRSVDDVYKAKEQQRQAEYNLALETHKVNLAREMEGWKAGYQKALDENRIRFSRLHVDRADAIRQLFVRMVTVEEAVGAVVNPVRLKAGNEEKLREEMKKAFTDFAQYFTQNRIFFLPADCERIEKLREIARKAYIDYTTYEILPEELEAKDKIAERQLRHTAYEAMTKEFPALRKSLEAEFRAAMGFVEPGTSTEAAK